MDRQSLSPPNRLATLFNIHPGEGRLVALLASLYFFHGLEIIPLGGCQSFSVEVWMPLGSTAAERQQALAPSDDHERIGTA